MNDLDRLARHIRFASFISVLLGAVGMTLSFLYLSSPLDVEVAAGAPGFVAGSVMIGAGLIAGALVTRRPAAVALAATEA